MNDTSNAIGYTCIHTYIWLTRHLGNYNMVRILYLIWRVHVFTCIHIYDRHTILGTMIRFKFYIWHEEYIYWHVYIYITDTPSWQLWSDLNSIIDMKDTYIYMHTYPWYDWKSVFDVKKNIHLHIYICIGYDWKSIFDMKDTYIYMYTYIWSASPYESCEIFEGRPRRNAFSKLVHCQYKSFPPDRFCQVEMKNPTRLSNKTSNAWSCAGDQILENKTLRNMILNICTER